MKSRKETGAIGEAIACAYLESKGFVIKHRNLYIGHLETDIVCEDDEHIVFAEEGIRNGGAGMLIRDALIKEGFDFSAVRYEIAAIDDSFASPDEPCDLYDFVGLSPKILSEKFLK